MAPASPDRADSGGEASSGQRRRWLFMAPRDIGLFLRSARTDAAIGEERRVHGARAAFESAYSEQADPWASGDQRYRYQRWKYEALLGFLPKGRRFKRALDLGSGIGAFSRALASVADEVLGLDIADAAVRRATGCASGIKNLRFAQGDVNDLDPALNGRFDLVAVADTLYYLDRVDDTALDGVAARIAELIVPDGLCLLANHYFFAADRDSRLSRRIHHAFARSRHFAVMAEYRRPFYLASLLARRSGDT